MAYKLGYCACCESQIMVQDTNRQWNSWMPDFRQAQLKVEGAPALRTPICKDCLSNPDLKKILENLIAPESTGVSERWKEFLKDKIPLSLVIDLKVPQGSSYRKEG